MLPCTFVAPFCPTIPTPGINITRTKVTSIPFAQPIPLTRPVKKQSRKCLVPSPPCLTSPVTPHQSSPLPSISCLSIHRKQIPNLLTYFRICLIPVLAAVGLLLPASTTCGFCSALFIIASLTDWLDGYLARKWNATSPLGQFLDPVADKLIVVVALIILSARFPLPFVTVSAALITAREIFISALREWMAIRGLSATVKVSSIGKLKTATQMIAISTFLAAPCISSIIARIGLILLPISAALTIISMVGYIKAAINVL